MDRRRFGALLAAGVGSVARLVAESTAPEMLRLKRNGWMPNNEALPVLVYRGAFPVTGDVASAM